MTTPQLRTNVIDTHVHLVSDHDWPPGQRRLGLRRTFTLDDFLKAAGPSTPTAVITVPSVPTVHETRHLLRVASNSSIIGGVVGWVDLTAPDADETVIRLRTSPGGDKLRGVRHPVQREPDPRWLERDDVVRGLRALTDQGLLYELLLRPDQLPAAATVAAQLPQMSFVLDHGGNPPQQLDHFDKWERDLYALASLQNVTCKISGQLVHHDGTRSSHFRRSANTLISAFGGDRLMFGSNYPLCQLTVGYHGTHSTARCLLQQLATDVLDDVLVRNAIVTYRLERRG